MTCPFPRYWICHALIALAVAVVVWPFLGLTFGLLIGAGFYAIREIIQWRNGKPFDWPGLLAPVLACAVVLAISLAI